MEIWKEVKGKEDYYLVSSQGRVKSIRFGKEHILKQTMNRGYFSVGLYGKEDKQTIRVHQLVAISFLNHKVSGHKLVVDHIDGNKLNNNVSNLQLISQRENASKDRRNGSSKHIGVSFDNKSKKWISQIYVGNKNKRLGLFESEIDASNEYQL